MRTFELTKEHLTLLKTSNMGYNDAECYWGFVGLDVKRPFGNSDIVSDMAEMLGVVRIEVDGGEMVWPAGTSERMKKLYEELAVAMQVILSTRSFKLGIYESEDHYGGWHIQVP